MLKLSIYITIITIASNILLTNTHQAHQNSFNNPNFLQPLPKVHLSYLYTPPPRHTVSHRPKDRQKMFMETTANYSFPKKGQLAIIFNIVDGVHKMRYNGHVLSF